ncbi:GNAT family N-acetyltransferase [Streptomyces sp. DSM 44915]|uniref:GNAT family N-acetyltransferase n=1 Tax=Streptomyces chisholmiae TaxID=3075540 RepID=A0ABU2JNZ3_9ACTN|nr:GNAT family N-acetyltransferase [Streptomyces sp. DSM 44915]MDT0265928.1 GNAT family N-acetyltransferase [Streptomyces sp. DSM 44915]
MSSPITELVSPTAPATVPELARAWVAGWTVSRRVPPPVADPWGLRIAVGAPGQRVRHVLPAADEALVRGLAATVVEPDVWLKTFVEPKVLRGWLPAGWVPDAPGWLMTSPLRPAHGPTPVPAGYTLSLTAERGVTQVRLHTPDGVLAARGQTAVVDTVAVVDQIATHPEHRRRGLGRLVMGALAEAAVAAGAHTGLLGATTEGRALYRTLGWRTRAPLTGFIHRPRPAR